MLKNKTRNTLLLFIVPALVLYLVFWVAPVLMSFYYGFTDWSGLGDYNFVGFKNFINLVTQGTLFNSLKNTVIYALFIVVWGNVQALILALLLNMKLKLRGFFRTVVYLPALFSTIVVAFLWSYVYAPYYGLLSEVVELFGGSWVPNLLGTQATSLIAVAFVESWRGCGTMTVIYLAGLQNVSEDVLEAARIDGSSAWQTTWRVRIPMISNTIIINVMLGLINGFKSFDYVFALTGGGPGTSSSTLMYSIYKMAFMEGQFGKAEAMAAYAFVFILAISGCVLALLRRKEIEL